jgi:hypothetical protein
MAVAEIVENAFRKKIIPLISRVVPAIRIGDIADFLHRHTGTQIRFPPFRIIKGLAFKNIDKLFNLQHSKFFGQTLYTFVKHNSITRHFLPP